MLPRHELDAIRFENLAESVLAPRVLVQSRPLEVRVFQCSHRPGIDALKLDAFTPVDLGWRWGPPWSTAWFQLTGSSFEMSHGGTPTLQFSSGTEATCWRDGVPYQGLDANRDLVRLPELPAPGDAVEFLIEAACTLPLGASTFWWDHPEVQARWREAAPGRLESAALVEVDEVAWSLHEAWDFAVKLLRALPPQQPQSVRLLAGLHLIASDIALADYDPQLLLASLCSLLETGQQGVGGPCIAVGHAHIDTAWLWPLAETRRKCLRSFATMLRLMERNRNVRFLCSQAQQYAWIEADAPALFAQIADRVRQGQWEAGGAMWIEPDCHVPSGESLIRQILHGTNWWLSRFGSAASQRHLYLPDTFGFPASLPQIIRLAGLDTFITNKMSWCETNRFPHVTFQWRGIDGTEVLTHLTPGHNYNSPIEPQDVLAGQGTLLGQSLPRPDVWLQPFGYGDGGGGPTQQMIDRIDRSGTCVGLPSVRHGRADDFCELLHQQATGQSLPVWDGDLYLELHRGTYTSQGWLKMANRVAEDDLRCIEALTCGMPAWSSDAAEAMRSTLDETWKLVLLNQFHDILPGSSITAVYDDARDQYDRIQSATAQAHQTARMHWIEPFDDGEAVCFNPASTTRSDVIDHEGEPRWVEAVRPLGAVAMGRSETASPHAVERDGLTLCNGLIEAELDPAGRLCHLSLCGASRGVSLEGDPLGQLMLYEDRPRRWEAWDIDADYVDTALTIDSEADIDVIETHPLRSIIEFRRSLGRASHLVQRWELRAGSPRIDVSFVVDWQEDRRLLRMLAPTAIRARMGTVGIQFGVQERPTHRNTSWEAARFEFPGHRFMDLSEAGRGLSILDDGRYGRSFHDHVMGLSLLRSPRIPDPEADRGTHRLTLAFLPHAGDWRAAGVWAEAEALCRPLQVLGTGTRSAGCCETHPFQMHIEGGAHIEIAAFKPAESGSGRILRLVEVHGGAGDIELAWSQPPGRVRAVDLHESDADRVEVVHQGCTTRMGIRPFQILTLRIEGDDTP